MQIFIIIIIVIIVIIAFVIIIIIIIIMGHYGHFSLLLLFSLMPNLNGLKVLTLFEGFAVGGHTVDAVSYTHLTLPTRRTV